MTRASVLIPIHDKPRTLPLTVDTVLRQSVQDLEVLLVGDGVTDQVRDVVAELVAADARVRFLDFPKGPHHGERYRHDAIEAACSDAIFYLCDDDLLLPDHVADLLALLDGRDLVQCLNGYVKPDGRVRLYAADLSDPSCVAMHLRDDLRFNSVSITGTAHTRAAYRRVSRWDTTPEGRWPDHWQFRKLMALPDFSGATSSRMTALQFPTSADGRDTWDQDSRAEEIVPWHRLVTAPGGQQEIDRRVGTGMLEQLVEDRERAALLSLQVVQLRREHTARREETTRLQAEVAGLREEVARVTRLMGEQADQARRLAEKLAARKERIESLRARLARKDDVIARLRARRTGGPRRT